MAPRKRTAQKQPVKKRSGFTISDVASEFYTNSAHVGFSKWEILLFFGSSVISGTVSQSGEQAANVQVDCVVRTSPAHAKAVHKVIGEVLGEYEDRYGEIPDLSEFD